MKAIVIAIFVLTSIFAGEENPSVHPENAPAPVKKPDPYAFIDTLLSSKDPAEQKKGADEIAKLLKGTPNYYTSQTICKRFVSKWQGLLVQNSQAAEYLTCSKIVLLSHPELTGEIESVLRTRVQILLATGRNDEALSDAKSLYNFSGLGGLARNTPPLADALKAARPAESAALLKRFKLEQLFLSETTGDAKKDDPVVKSIKVDAEEYEAAINAAKTGNYYELLAFGNLLLLADQCSDARKVFERAYRQAPADHLNEVIDRIAAAYKAEDGNPSRAQDWLAAAKASIGAATPPKAAAATTANPVPPAAPPRPVDAPVKPPRPPEDGKNF